MHPDGKPMNIPFESSSLEVKAAGRGSDKYDIFCSVLYQRTLESAVARFM